MLDRYTNSNLVYYKHNGNDEPYDHRTVGYINILLLYIKKQQQFLQWQRHIGIATGVGLTSLKNSVQTNCRKQYLSFSQWWERRMLYSGMWHHAVQQTGTKV